MLTSAESKKIIRGLDRNVKECKNLERKRRDSLFISGVLSICTILSVITFGEVLITFSWVITSVISLYLCFKLLYIRSEEKETKYEIKKSARTLLEDDELDYNIRREVENLIIAI